MSRYRVENAAQLAVVLARKADNMQERPDRSVSHDVSELQRIARSLHRMDERACNEDLGCRKCDGRGFALLESGAAGAPIADPARESDRMECKSCAGSGLTTGKREARLVAQATAIAEAYGFRLYQQGDPRGWPLYLIPDNYPASEDGSWYSSRGVAVCPA